MISIAIPALNEEERIRATVDAILSVTKEMGGIPVEIIIVNDGSTDGTAAEIGRLEREFPFIRSIHHRKNMGFGVSFMDAVRIAKYEKISLFAGDNVTSPYTIKNILKNRNAADVIVAYPLNTEVRSPFRRIVSTLFNLLYCATFEVHMKYLQGAPCFPVARVKELDIRASGYSVLAEINVKLLRSGATFMEVDGYFNPQPQMNSSIKLRSLVKALSSFLGLVYEVKVRDRSRYLSPPRRIVPSLERLDGGKS